MLNVSVAQVYSLARSGQLPYRRLGPRTLRWLPEDVSDFVEAAKCKVDSRLQPQGDYATALGSTRWAAS